MLGEHARGVVPERPWCAPGRRGPYWQAVGSAANTTTQEGATGTAYGRSCANAFATSNCRKTATGLVDQMARACVPRLPKGAAESSRQLKRLLCTTLRCPALPCALPCHSAPEAASPEPPHPPGPALAAGAAPPAAQRRPAPARAAPAEERRGRAGPASSRAGTAPSRRRCPSGSSCAGRAPRQPARQPGTAARKCRLPSRTPAGQGRAIRPSAVASGPHPMPLSPRLPASCLSGLPPTSAPAKPDRLEHKALVGAWHAAPLHRAAAWPNAGSASPALGARPAPPGATPASTRGAALIQCRRCSSATAR